MDDGQIGILIEKLSQELTETKKSVGKVVRRPLSERSANSESNSANVELFNDYGLILVNLFISYLNVLGEKAESHPIYENLDKVKRYIRDHEKLKNGTSEDDHASTEKFLANTINSTIDKMKIGSKSFKNENTEISKKSSPEKKKSKVKSSKDKVSKPKNKKEKRGHQKARS